MTAPLLSVDGLDAGTLADVGLDVGAGQAVALLGANGAGKSTLLRAVIGLEPVRRGRIVFDGTDLTGLPPERRARLGLGYVPEGRRVFPGMSVRDNLEVASHRPAAARRDAVERVFALFPQLRAKAAAHAWQLSGGQQQMLAIGRALMGEPRLLLLDEPSLGLSPRLVAAVFEAVGAIVATGTAVLVAEQTVARALALANQAVLLRLGQVVRRAPAAELAADLGHRGAIGRAFLGDIGGDLGGEPLAPGSADG